jgi:hypothetical protein
LEFLFFYPRKFGFKPGPDTLPDHPEASIAVQVDRADNGFHGVGKDRILPGLPEILFPAPEPDEPLDLHAPTDFGKAAIVLQLLFYAGNPAFALDAFLH